jgi:hypothetical protein
MDSLAKTLLTLPDWGQCAFCRRVLPDTLRGVQQVRLQANGYCDDCQVYAPAPAAPSPSQSTQEPA